MVVYTEGKPDQILVRRLGIANKFIGDGKHKAGVLKKVAGKTDVLGIVDQDPETTQSRPKLMNEFQLVEKEYRVIVYFHRSSKNKLIILCPGLEGWVLKAAEASKINVADFKLPKKPSSLHNVVNNHLSSFEKLINELIARQNPSILYLQTLLTHP